jgi:hypothetical protein
VCYQTSRTIREMLDMLSFPHNKEYITHRLLLFKLNCSALKHLGLQHWVKEKSILFHNVNPNLQPSFELWTAALLAVRVLNPTHPLHDFAHLTFAAISGRRQLSLAQEASHSTRAPGLPDVYRLTALQSNDP